ncbi:hypothetical protein G6011_00078 [Alternaria panax]|uniref:Uncharacterized protein n=1 Tax=Alternaria panax TaxID=48097 RepID=A0AAD4IHJ5_9PLEO|nr:hypothetical protein G6011_00078 [Alternaria panax]
MFVSSREEEKIHSHKGDADIPLNAFETARGRFWTFKGLRKYVKARRELIYGLSRINTGEAIETALYLSARLMWLDPKDAMCIRSIVPVLLLRSRRDQQAYNFCKWWLTTGNDTHHEWEYGEPPYLKTNDSDAFEHVGYFEHVWRGTDDDERRTIMPSPADLSHLVAIMLVKVRIFLDLRFLHYDDSPETFTEKYRSSIVLDLYKKSLPYGNPLRSDMNLYDGLAYHVRELYRVVDRVNKHFWPALLASGHGKNLEIRQGPSTMGSRGEAIVTLEDYYDAWAETPNAINFVRTITEEKQRSPHWK